jgi:anti-sigma28 factor (negative regulator of flagellin synthesis)
MKITNDEAIRARSIDPISAPKLQPHTPNPTVQAAPGAGPAAQVEISAQAKALGAAKTEAASYLPAVHAAPDTRTDLVSKLKTQVDSGAYHVASADIADQIVRRAQADKIQ